MNDGVGVNDIGAASLSFTSEHLQSALQNAVALPDFLKNNKEQLSFSQCLTIVDEAIRLLQGLYVHLPLKRAMYAVDPVRRLRLLQYRLEQFRDLQCRLGAGGTLQAGEQMWPADDLWFHREMTNALTSVRDLHTIYVLPDPFSGAVAFVPFQIEDFFDGSQDNPGERRFIVSNVIEGCSWFEAPADFVRGAEITHWNWIPIQRAVELAGEQNAGSNPEARLARGLARLTIRPLVKSLPPDEESVTIGYKSLSGKKAPEFTVHWRVASLPDGQAAPTDGATLLQATNEGLDHESDLIRVIRGGMYGPGAKSSKRGWTIRPSSVREVEPVSQVGRITPVQDVPEFLEAKTLSFQGTEYGYIRIRSFKTPKDEAFLSGFIDLVERMPGDGLIIDVRDNPGGSIACGERLLQVLTPKAIQPEPMQFIASPLSLEVSRLFSIFHPWTESIKRALETKTTFSSSISLTSPDKCNDRGQRYYGPVVLITNALCYSTTDMFAAGFQDHEIGIVLGTDGSTGAGGANVTKYSRLRAQYLDVKENAALFGNEEPVWPLGQEPLPFNADFHIAIRRSLRVGERAGTELEDLGVIPHHRHWMTRNDILQGNIDLLESAATLLSRMDVYQLQVSDMKLCGADTAAVSVDVQGIDWLDVVVDGWASGSQPTHDGPNQIYAKWQKGRPTRVMELCGYGMKNGRSTVVARRKVRMPKFP